MFSKYIEYLAFYLLLLYLCEFEAETANNDLYNLTILLHFSE